MSVFTDWKKQGTRLIITCSLRPNSVERSLVEKIAKRLGLDLELVVSSLPVRRAASGTRVSCCMRSR